MELLSSSRLSFPSYNSNSAAGLPPHLTSSFACTSSLLARPSARPSLHPIPLHQRQQQNVTPSLLARPPARPPPPPPTHTPPPAPEQSHAKLVDRHGSVGLQVRLRGQVGQVLSAAQKYQTTYNAVAVENGSRHSVQAGRKAVG